MTRHLVILLCGITLCLGALSCRRVSSGPTQLLKTEPIKSIDAIPSEYGNLVSVTSRSPTSALLWFERPDKTIVIVGIQLQGDDVSLAGRVAMVPRGSQ